MGAPKIKQPNAQIHGAFAATSILGGESHREFKDLLSGLVAEWNPAGPTEEDAVLTIAKGMWRKRRVKRFFEHEFLQKTLDPNHPAHNPVWALIGLAYALANIPGATLETHGSRFLPDHLVVSLERRFPPPKFESLSSEAIMKAMLERNPAIVKYINSVLLPAMRFPKRMGAEVALARSASAWSPDFLEQELALDERINVSIDRAVKRLAQIKMAKQILAERSAQAVDDQHREIPSDESNGTIVSPRDHPSR